MVYSVQPGLQAQHLGVHTLGRCSTCPKDGLVPLKFDAFRKNLSESSEYAEGARSHVTH